jgi:hypothetical protein
VLLFPNLGGRPEPLDVGGKVESSIAGWQPIGPVGKGGGEKNRIKEPGVLKAKVREVGDSGRSRDKQRMMV